MQNAAFFRVQASFFALGLIITETLGVAAEPSAFVRPRPEDMVGTQSCTAVSCHGGGGPRYWSGSAKGAEYVHWLGTGGTYSDGRRSYDPWARLIKSDGDPHAAAAQRMQQPRFQEVLRRASGRADGSADPAMLERCAKCHDPATEARSAERGVRKASEGSDAGAVAASTAMYSVHSTQYSMTVSQPSAELLPPTSTSPQSANLVTGIGCEACHGGARQWMTSHYQSGVSRDELLRRGMVDTKDLLVRARLCASCHVGSADQDMNHDMIAAGHPPLRFEQASYEALLGRKHWDDAPARAANPNYEVQLWAAGRRAASVAALELLEARCHGTGDLGHKPWPEFAESNCLACHQPLRRNLSEPDERASIAKHLRSASWQTWNTSLLEASILPRPATEAELPSPGGSWSSAIQQLRSVMVQKAEPNRQQVATLASKAKLAIAGQTTDDLSAVTASLLLEKIGELDRDATWDELCQYLAALAAARRALDDQGKLRPAAADLFQRRIEHVAAALRFVAPHREWPVLYSDDSSLSAADVLRELAQIRQDLLSEARR